MNKHNLRLVYQTMARKLPKFGVNNYHKRTPKKRPGRHTKRLNKRVPRRKPYKGQGRQFRTILMFEKVTIITLLYLTTLGDIQMQSFEVVSGDTCESWYHHNVKVTERKKRLVFGNHYYHKYKGKDVIGYICSDEPPQ